MKNLLWRPVNAFQFTFFFLWSAFWVTVAVPLATVTRRRSLALTIARRIWAPGIFKVVGLELEVDGADRLDPNQAYYFACNHQSFFDIPVLFGGLPNNLHFIAKAELRRFPFIGWFISAMGMVFVDRGHRSRGLQAIEEVVALLRSGGSVISFSEGTRGDGRSLKRFKSGGFQAPLAADVQVVPVGILGTATIMPPRTLRLRPGKVQLRIGEPIDPTLLPKPTRQELAIHSQSRVASLLGVDDPADRNAVRAQKSG